MKITFFGSDKFTKLVLESFLSESLKHLISELRMVLPYPGLSQQNPTAELEAYLKLSKIPFVHYNKSFKEIKQFLIEYPQDVGIVASFGAMIPSYIIDQYSKGMIVLHPSLLPKYRGACPIQHSLINNEVQTGISIIQISKHKFDAGKILLQEEMDILPIDGYIQLRDRLAIRGGEMLVKCIQDYDHLLQLGVHQDPQFVSKAPFLAKEIAYLNWYQMDNKQISSLFRGINGTQLKPFSKLLIGKKIKLIYFEMLTEYIPGEYEVDITSEMPPEYDVVPGSLHWNIKVEEKYFLIKAKEGWVKCSGSVMLDGGKKKIREFLVKYLGNQSYARVGQIKFQFI